MAQGTSSFPSADEFDRMPLDAAEEFFLRTHCSRSAAKAAYQHLILAKRIPKIQALRFAIDPSGARQPSAGDWHGARFCGDWVLVGPDSSFFMVLDVPTVAILSRAFPSVTAMPGITLRKSLADDRLMTSAEVCREFNISRSTLQGWQDRDLKRSGIEHLKVICTNDRGENQYRRCDVLKFAQNAALRSRKKLVTVRSY